MSTHKVSITRKGLADLKHEYNELVYNKRPLAVKRVADAREQGDLSENSEYSAAKDELTFIDERIHELEEILKNAELVSDVHSKSVVTIGCKVIVHIDGKEHVLTIVGEPEANPQEKKISPSSPVGKSLMGHIVGDTVKVEAPAGTMAYKILSIE